MAAVLEESEMKQSLTHYTRIVNQLVKSIEKHLNDFQVLHRFMENLCIDSLRFQPFSYDYDVPWNLFRLGYIVLYAPLVTQEL